MDVSHDEYTVIVDNPVLMTCEANGIPAPQITWTTHGEDVADVKDASTFHVLANGALRIDRVTTEDSGMYECIASNVAGNASKAVTLTVHGAFNYKCFYRHSLYRVRRSRGEMYIGYGRSCLCVCPSPHYHTIARTRMQLGGIVGGAL